LDARSRALDLHLRGDLAAAEALYTAILDDTPNDHETLHRSGVAALQSGDPVRATSLLERAVSVEPSPIYLSNLGAALRRCGRPTDAAVVLRRAIGLDPSNAEAHCNLAGTCCALSAWNEALRAAERALALQPNMAEAQLNRATALLSLAQPAAAESACRAALMSMPNWPDAWFVLAGSRLAQGQVEDAVAAYRKVLAFRADDVDALINLGSALGRGGHYDEAELVLRRAMSLAPARPEAALNLGGILRTNGRLGEARELQEAILRRDDRYWAAWSNLAAILHDLAQPDAAEAAWQRSLALNPNQPDASYGRALSLLLAGNFVEGWDQLEHRWQATQHRGRARHMHLPLWGGEDLTGRTILLHAEEGLGDTIQFVRYAPLVARRGAQVVLETYAPLAALFSGIEGVAHCVVRGEPTQACDAFTRTHAAHSDSSIDPGDTAFGHHALRADMQCPLQSLPRAFRTRLETIPAEIPYLRPTSESLTQWTSRLSQTTARRVGLVWAGNPNHGKDRQRSIALDQLAALWRVPGIAWFSLQAGPRAADLSTMPPGVVTDLSQDLVDFNETAAALCNLDLLITVDTSVAHLAGALGRPVWLLLPFAPDWRWLLGRSDSPWYPTMRLFRQHVPGDWATPVSELLRMLERQPPLPSPGNGRIKPAIPSGNS
jgi:tetratricopeptide (TPR) repeat protein